MYVLGLVKQFNRLVGSKYLRSVSYYVYVKMFSFTFWKFIYLFFCLVNYLYLIKINQLCSWMTSPIGRRSIVHQCAECCDPTSSPNCNGRLCNFSGTHFSIEMTINLVNKNYDCILFFPRFLSSLLWSSSRCLFVSSHPVCRRWGWYLSIE